MFADVFLTGTVQKVYEPKDGIVYAKVKSVKTIQTKEGPITSFANVLLKQREGYEQYVGKLELGDLIFARGYLEVNDNGNPVTNNKGEPIFILVPWTVRILGETVTESINDEFSVTALGYLGKEPEMRYMDDGTTAVTNISLATSRGYSSNGAVVKETTWWRVAFWRKLAESVNVYTHKGSRILVVGSINYDEKTHGPRVFTRRDGTTGSSFEVMGLSFTFADSKSDNKSGNYREMGVNPDNDFNDTTEAKEDDGDIPL